MSTHITSRSWTTDQLKELRKLVDAGASPARAAARFNRSRSSVQLKAKQSGFPFTDVREVKRHRRQRESEARRDLGLD